ncbi:MAG: GNAT family N-acetyltransferase [Spirochaetes bacterium]|nr:GNAT family N-acetyltransferase [Spirochaetota bacterium]
MEQYAIRRAVAADVDILVRHRRLMMEEISAVKKESIDPHKLDVFDTAYGDFLRERIDGAGLYAFIVLHGNDIAASGTASLLSGWPPTVDIPHVYDVLYVYGVYTEVQHRGRGCAATVMQAINAEAKKRGIPRVTLYASDAGKGVYERAGFISKPSWMILQTAVAE